MKSNLALFGTANPTNAIGPQKAVTKPVKTAVTPIHAKRKVCIFIPNNLDAWEPNTKVFNGFIKNKERKSPAKNTNKIKGNWSKETDWSEPIVQSVKDFNSSDELLVCKIEMMELVKLPSIKPINSNEMCERTKDEKLIMMSPKIKAPSNALVMMLKSWVKNGIPVINEHATNKLEPVFMPRTYGPASGLLNKVCINIPETAKLLPETIAIIKRGILNSWMINSVELAEL